MRPVRSVVDSSGVALIVVLWISAILTLLLYAFLVQANVEYSLADGFGREKQAEQLALSGVDKAIATILADTRTHHTLADPWANSETEFYEVEIGDGVFTLLHPAYKDGKMRWGADDEASKLNINVATKEMLMKLPGMTDEIADSILDWRDADENPQPSGAESSYYEALQPGYSCKNAPFETIEELLYARGVTPAILYGEDANLNGILDPNEDDGDKTLPNDNMDGKLDLGLYPFVTVHSYDKNQRADGKPRIDLNTSTPQQQQQELGDVLSGQILNRITQYRIQNGGFRSIAHLLDVQGLTPALFRQVADRVTIFGNTQQIPGLINVNTAPKQVLMCLPGIREDFVDALIAYRTQSGVDLSNIGWLMEIQLDDNVKKAQMKAIANYLTTRSYQFRIDAVGRVGQRVEGVATEESPRPFAFKRFVAIYDKAAATPRLMYFKDMSTFGFPYDPWEKPLSP